MKITTNGTALLDTIEFFSMTGFDLKALGDPRADMKTGQMKLGPSGRPTYSVRGLTAEADGRVVENLYLAVEEPCDIDRRSDVVLTGTVWLTPFVMNGNLAFSVVAEGMAPAGPDGKPVVAPGKPADAPRSGGLPTPSKGDA